MLSGLAPLIGDAAMADVLPSQIGEVDEGEPRVQKQKMKVSRAKDSSRSILWKDFLFGSCPSLTRPSAMSRVVMLLISSGGMARFSVWVMVVGMFAKGLLSVTNPCLTALL